jgi:hypothetical protein
MFHSQFELARDSDPQFNVTAIGKYESLNSRANTFYLANAGQSKKSLSKAKRDHQINQRIANGVITDDCVKKPLAASTSQFSESVIFDDQNAVDDHVFVESKNQTLLYFACDEGDGFHFDLALLMSRPQTNSQF